MSKVINLFNRKETEKRLDDIARAYVLLRDHHICISCGIVCHGNATIGHLITRTNRRVRWHIDNIYCQCSPCNFEHEYRPEIMTKKVIDKVGTNKYIELVQKSMQPYHKYTYDDLEEIYNNLKNLYTTLSKEGFSL